MCSVQILSFTKFYFNSKVILVMVTITKKIRISVSSTELSQVLLIYSCLPFCELVIQLLCHSCAAWWHILIWHLTSQRLSFVSYQGFTCYEARDYALYLFKIHCTLIPGHPVSICLLIEGRASVIWLLWDRNLWTA